MKLTQIRHMLAVAERASLQAGADALGVSQSALVRSIRNLEQELGAALFQRRDRSMTLTPVGQIFIRRAAAAQLELDRASDDLKKSPASSTGRVAIGLSLDAQALILPKALPSFQRRFPNVCVQIVEGAFSKLGQELRDGVLDIYVGPIWSTDHTAGLKIDKLDDVVPMVVGRRDHPLASATSLAQLADAPWITASRPHLTSLFERRRLAQPTIVVEAETGLSLLSAAASSHAFVMASETWSPTVARTDVLMFVSIKEKLDPYPICAVVRSQPPLTAQAAYLHALTIRTRKSTA